jgi:hypothetical protein
MKDSTITSTSCSKHKQNIHVQKSSDEEILLKSSNDIIMCHFAFFVFSYFLKNEQPVLNKLLL